MRAFADAGMKVVANVKPCLLDDHPRYGEVAAEGCFIAGGADRAPLKSQFWDGEGAHVDFTHPAGVAWWKESLTREVLDAGVDAGWNDNNEYGLWDDEATCAGFGEPTPLALMRPVQALLMTRATREAQLAARPHVRPFTVTRAGGPGLQRYAQTWSGDNTTSWASLKWKFSHRPRHVALRPVQHRPRRRRLRRAGPRPRTADPLDAGGAPASALHHEQLEGRRRHDLALAAPQGAAGDPRGAAAALRLMPYLYSAMVVGARGACPRAQADLHGLRGRSRLIRRRGRRDVRPLPARRAGLEPRRARRRGLSPGGRRKLARRLDRARSTRPVGP